MQTLTALCNDLRAAGVKGAVWVDGSFLTEKLDPADADLVVAVDTVATAPSPNVLAALDKVAKHQYVTPARCDSYVMADKRLEPYWVKQFGFSRAKDVKGIAVLTL